jgi:hypothetical protein
MDSNKDNDSLDKQVNHVFRQRGGTSFWTAITAAGAFLISTLTGCFAKDIRLMNPDLYRAKAAAYENNLPNIAEAMGLN